MPRLKKRLGATVIKSRVLKTFGLSEAKLGEMVGGFVQSANPTLATYSKADGIHLRITAKAKDEAIAVTMLHGIELLIREMLGNAIWGADDDTMPIVVGRLLSERHLTLAIMESCTGGLLAAAITDVPGSSTYFLGGIVSYTNKVKIDNGVPADLIQRHGAVSQPVAEAMATAIKTRLGSDVGVSITGAAGPSELERKRPGTVYIAVSYGDSTQVLFRRLPGDRQRVRQLATTAALVQILKAVTAG